MGRLRAGIIGCGGRGWSHACGYKNTGKVDVVACCDVYRPAAERLAAGFGPARVFTDYRQMLAEAELDIVSMALWPELHADAVLACAEAKRPPRLVNAEKPMAPTWGEARRMHEACEAAGVRLTLCHQRRFQPGFVLAHRLVHEGAIGQLVQLEAYTSNLFDWGTHWFDMLCHFNDQQPIEWVMGQVDCGEDRRVFGALVETSGLAYWRWRNGVTGLLATGPNPGGGCPIRLVGTKGVIEFVHCEGGFRILREGHSAWETPACTVPKFPSGDPGTNLHLADAVDGLLEGRESILCSRNALQATELIFATYESSRRREKVFLPLKSEDSALLSMVSGGELAIPDWPAFLTPEEKEQGFELLLNGRDTGGWKMGGARAAWVLAGGLLHSDGARRGWLQTEAQFADFVLRFEFRLGSRGLCELGLRTAARPRSGAGEIGIRLFDDRREPVSADTTGTVCGKLLPRKSMTGGGCSWNRAEVRLEGAHLTLTLNGEVIQDTDLAAALGPAADPRPGRVRFLSQSARVDLRALRLLRLG